MGLIPTNLTNITKITNITNITTTIISLLQEQGTIKNQLTQIFHCGHCGEAVNLKKIKTALANKLDPQRDFKNVERAYFKKENLKQGNRNKWSGPATVILISGRSKMEQRGNREAGVRINTVT